MSSPDQITEQIREFMAAEGDAWTDELADAAATHAAMCREVNDRIRRCTEYLRRGMRSEAVHLAWCQPFLLDEIKALRLPDHAAWARACARNGIAAPPELLPGLSDRFPRELEEAVIRERSLEPLLARHRLLALAKAPLRDRLEVLRVLATRDADSPCWPREVLDLEAIRLKEMRSEAKAAYRARNLAAASDVWQELTGRDWKVAVPEDLRAGLEKVMATLRFRAALDEVRGLLRQLNASFESKDADRGAALATKWQALVESRGLTLPPELLTRVRPILKWVATEQRRRDTERRLEAARPAIRADEERRLRRAVARKRWLTLAVSAGVGVGALLVAGVRLWWARLHHP